MRCHGLDVRKIIWRKGSWHMAAEILKPDAGGEQLAETHAHGEPPRIFSPRFTEASGSRPIDGYTIKRGVGAGGFGEVYYATSDAGKDVALKKIQRNLDIELRGVRQCLNLKHPNLVSLHDIRFGEDGQAWVVMEFVEGTNLQRIIEQHPNGMPAEELHFWWDGVTAGVMYLHDSGIVHRDLKPGNIFLDGSIVKIGDYGLSKFISCSRRSGQTQSVGTFHYMAPEIGQGRYGKEIDIYALGIILFEMLTGRVPFDGESSQEIIMKHLTAKPPLDGVRQPYRDLIERALAKDPAARVASVHELRGILPGERGVNLSGAWTPPVRGFSSGSASSPATPGSPAAPASLASPAIPVSPAAAAWPLSTEAPLDLSADAPPSPPPASPGGTAKSAVVRTLQEEPVARAFTAAWNELAASWNQIGPGWRWSLMGLAIALLIFNSRWLIPYVGALAVYYGLYLGIRALIVSNQRRKRGTEQMLVAATFSLANAKAEIDENRQSRRTKRETKSAAKAKLQAILDQRSAGKRFSETVGACILAAGIVAVLGFAICLLYVMAAGFPAHEIIPNFLWLTISSTVATWGVLSIHSTSDGDLADAGMRRFLLLIVGFAVGGCAFFLSRAMAFYPSQIVHVTPISMPFYRMDGAPEFPLYLAYFGAAFCLPRWWKQAEPLRSTRLNLWTTAMIVMFGVIMQAVFLVPQGFVVLGIASGAVQLAAPWLSPKRRQELIGETAAAV